MRVLVQWAKDSAVDWEEIDSSDWTSTANKPIPSGSNTPDSVAGWVNGLNVQGVVFEADHYHVEHNQDGSVVVTCWNDDSDDWTEAEYLAWEITFLPYTPDASFGGALNTRQTQVIYAGTAHYDDFVAKALPNTTIKPWADFTEPPTGQVRHGVWLDGALYDNHAMAQTTCGWREWTEGLDSSEIDNGKVKSQRAQGRYDIPTGTRTYYHNNVSQNQTIEGGADFSDQLGTQTAIPTFVATSNASGTGSVGFFASTPSQEPDHAQWPTGDYRYQIDCTSVNSNIEYGVLALGTNGNGYFARTNSALSSALETKVQTQSAFILTGLKMASTGSVSWSAGADTDRFAVSLAFRSTGGHGNQKLTLELGELDDFADGPWTAPVAPTANAVFMGMNF